MLCCHLAVVSHSDRALPPDWLEQCMSWRFQIWTWEQDNNNFAPSCLMDDGLRTHRNSLVVWMNGRSQKDRCRSWILKRKTTHHQSQFQDVGHFRGETWQCLASISDHLLGGSFVVHNFNWSSSRLLNSAFLFSLGFFNHCLNCFIMFHQFTQVWNVNINLRVHYFCLHGTLLLPAFFLGFTWNWLPQMKGGPAADQKWMAAESLIDWQLMATTVVFSNCKK